MKQVSIKRAAIFFNGDLSNLKSVKNYLNPTDLIICADGAAENALNSNIIPSIIIGDFDSLSKFAQGKLRKYPIKWIRFPREKDQTDSELAIAHAVSNNCKEILIFGLFGSRLDHLLTNIFALKNLTTKGIDAVIIEGKQEIRIINNYLKLKGKIGDLVSLIPIKGDVRQVTTEGLKYKLNNEDLLFGYSRGISNVFAKKEVEVSIKDGSLLAIHYKN